MTTIISLIVAYLLGSLSTAIILSKFMKFEDPRQVGSGNAGATNVLRSIGKNEATFVLIGDIAKGFIAVLIGRILGVEGVMLGFVAVAAVVGHIFPVFFKFKGGKGVATGIGAVLMLSFWAAILAAIVFAGVLYFFKYVSLASMVGAISAPIFILLFGNHLYAFPVFVIAALIIWRHQENIKRLMNGSESKVNL